MLFRSKMLFWPKMSNGKRHNDDSVQAFFPNKDYHGNATRRAQRRKTRVLELYGLPLWQVFFLALVAKPSLLRGIDRNLTDAACRHLAPPQIITQRFCKTLFFGFSCRFLHVLIVANGVHLRKLLDNDRVSSHRRALLECCCSSVVERVIGNDEVGSSILPSSTRNALVNISKRVQKSRAVVCNRDLSLFIQLVISPVHLRHPWVAA